MGDCSWGGGILLLLGEPFSENFLQAFEMVAEFRVMNLGRYESRLGNPLSLLRCSILSTPLAFRESRSNPQSWGRDRAWGEVGRRERERPEYFPCCIAASGHGDRMGPRPVTNASVLRICTFSAGGGWGMGTARDSRIGRRLVIARFPPLQIRPVDGPRPSRR